MKILEIIADSGHMDTLASIAEQHGSLEWWLGNIQEDNRQAIRILVPPDKRQAVMDAVQSALKTAEKFRIIVIPVEATLPRPPSEEEKNQPAATTTREELYNSIEKGARRDRNYFLLVILSTIVAAIGLLESNVAVVIGAMVIAPLLGPNLALALATSLGDTQLMWRALGTNAIGLSIALLLSFALGLIFAVDVTTPELAARTDVGLDSAALALASGAAAVLSLTTGLPSVLVGVMVAVALLPPTATLGLMLGQGELDLAAGAGLLLAVNIVCVNLAAKLVFLFTGVRPRTWLEQKKAKQSMVTYILVWVISLTILLIVIVAR